MSPQRLKSVLVPALFLLSAGAANAVKVAATVPQMRPAPSKELLEKFHDAVVRGLQKGGEVMPGAETRGKLAADPAVAGCAGDKCAKGVAALLKVDRVATTTIDADGKTYTIKVSVFEAGGDRIGATVEELCDICTMREATEAIERAAEKAAPLLGQGGPAVAAAPAPAVVVVEKPAAKPIEKAAPPKVVVVEKPVAAVVEEDEPIHEAVAMAEPKREPAPAPVVVETPPAPTHEPLRLESPSDSARSAFPYRPVGIAALVVAGGALIATIGYGYFLGLGSAPTCNMPNPKTSCMQVYASGLNAAGVIGFGVGTVAAAAVGALLLVVDHKHRLGTAQIGVAPTRDGVAAAASFTF